MKQYSKYSGVYFNKVFNGNIQDFEYAKHKKRHQSFQRELNHKFGNDLCNLFFYPFNDKYTGGLYNKILPQDSYKSPSKGEKHYNSAFFYPSEGLSKMIDNLAGQNTIHYNKKAVSIDISKKEVSFLDGTTVGYDRIISTIPLNNLLHLCGINVEFPHTSTLVLNIGAVPGKNLPKEHWLYIPFCNSGFYRVGIYSNVDASFAPKDRVSIYVEKTYSGEDISTFDLEERIIDELLSWRWIDGIETFDLNFIPTSYTWVYEGTDIETYLRELRKQNILSIGRYGKWKFQGIAESVLDGLGVTYE
jgi:protoporphyrinogen oxidase